MSFSHQMAGYFDEMSKIVDEKKHQMEKERRSTHDGPFSNLLTRDEEPQTGSYPEEALRSDQPEIIVRGY